MSGNLRNFFENTIPGIVVSSVGAFALAFGAFSLIIWMMRMLVG